MLYALTMHLLRKQLASVVTHVDLAALRTDVVTAGALVLLFSGAEQAGLVEVHWDKVEGTVMEVLDFNKDGKIDQKDATVAFEKFVGFFKKNTAFAGGSFTGGLIAGLRMG